MVEVGAVATILEDVEEVEEIQVAVAEGMAEILAVSMSTLPGHRNSLTAFTFSYVIQAGTVTWARYLPLWP